MAEQTKDQQYDVQLRQPWRIGEKFLVHTKPSVEGMIGGTKWINEIHMILFVVPSFTKADGSFEKAALMLQSVSSCSKQKLLSYEFPFPEDSRLKLEVQKANGNQEALQEIISYLNQQPVLLPLTPPPVFSTSLPGSEALLAPLSPNKGLVASSSSSTSSLHDKGNISSSSASHLPSSVVPAAFYDENVLAHLANELSRRLTFSPPSNSSQQVLTVSSSSSTKSHILPQSLSSSSSSSRSSASSRSSSRVRKRKHKSTSGYYTCPFASSDVRHAFNPHKRFQSKSEERKYLRRALHDLYSEYSTLRNFVDSVRTHLFSSPTRPYTSDLIWLQQHADYLDCLNLYMIGGPWSVWNDLVVDKITRAFLELLVRVSPNRHYPDILDESVRKWMRKKRVGICSQFGPVPNFLNDAKVTESGVQPKTGWDNWRSKDSKDSRTKDGVTSSSNARPRAFFPSSTEKK